MELCLVEVLIYTKKVIVLDILYCSRLLIPRSSVPNYRRVRQSQFITCVALILKIDPTSCVQAEFDSIGRWADCIQIRMRIKRNFIESRDPTEWEAASSCMRDAERFFVQLDSRTDQYSYPFSIDIKAFFGPALLFSVMYDTKISLLVYNTEGSGSREWVAHHTNTCVKATDDDKRRHHDYYLLPCKSGFLFSKETYGHFTMYLWDTRRRRSGQNTFKNQPYSRESWPVDH